MILQWRDAEGFGRSVGSDEFLARKLEEVNRDCDAIWAAGVILKVSLEEEESTEEGVPAGREMVDDGSDKVMIMLCKLMDTDLLIARRIGGEKAG